MAARAVKNAELGLPVHSTFFTQHYPGACTFSHYFQPESAVAP